MEYVILATPFITALFEKCNEDRVNRAFADAKGNKRRKRRFALRQRMVVTRGVNDAIEAGDIDEDEREEAIAACLDYCKDKTPKQLRQAAIAGELSA